jgi:signal transduction histidine kinase
LTISGAARPLPPAIDLTAYRIVQESLTNILRHAQATSATVRLRYENDVVEVEVDDDGRGSERPPSGVPDTSSAGHGLAVMAERAAAVGGQLVAGPKEAGGFCVHTRLPLREVTS